MRADELFGHSEGVLDTSDIERVHDMRVASRRLRAVLEIFEPCFSRRATSRPSCVTSRRWPTRSASAATRTCTSRTWRSSRSTCRWRNPAGHRGAGREAARTAGARQRHSGRRARAPQRVQPARAPALARRRRRGADRGEGEAGQGPRPGGAASPTTPSGSRRACGLDELTSFAPKATDPDEVVALHDMRIAAKRRGTSSRSPATSSARTRSTP